MRLTMLLMMLIVVTGARVAQEPDLSRYFRDTRGTFVLYDLKRDRYIRYNEKRANERMTPYSTFKIPNSLIGLETGVIKDADYVIAWDRAKYPENTLNFESWKRDHDLRSAFRNSVLWYYREVAVRVGKEKMAHYMDKMGYGNHDISGGIDKFWLNSSLLISANEQIEFLKALYRNELPFSRRSLDIVKEIMVQEETPEYRLRAKTGGGYRGELGALGWYVGYLERGDNVYFFAINIDGRDFGAIRDKRITMTKTILTDLGYLPVNKDR